MRLIFRLRDAFDKIFTRLLQLLNADGRKSGEGPRGGNKTEHTIFMLHDVTSLYNVHSRDYTLSICMHLGFYNISLFFI